MVQRTKCTFISLLARNAQHKSIFCKSDTTSQATLLMCVQRPVKRGTMDTQ